MSPIDRAAIESATAAALLALNRLHDALKHLHALAGGEQKPLAEKRNGPPPTLYQVDGSLHTAQELSEMAGCSKTTMQTRLRKFTPKQALAMGKAQRRDMPGAVFGGKEVRSFEYQGQTMTVGQLAKLAGCHSHAMNLRLRRYSVEEAVAMGARATAKADSLRKGPAPRLYALGDEQVTVKQLAERAGCGLSAMKQRLTTMTTEAAVAMGKVGKRGRGKKPEFFASPKQAKPVAKELAKASVTTRALNTPAKPPQGPVIVPADVKRTVAVAPVDKRFAVDPALVVPVFSRLKPGQYLPSDSALVRHLESA